MMKSDLIRLMKEKYVHLNKDNVENGVNIFFNALSESLKHDAEIELRGFASFFLKRMPPKEARNPQTGKKIYAMEGKKIVFKPSESLRNIVNK